MQKTYGAVGYATLGSGEGEEGGEEGEGCEAHFEGRLEV